MREAWMVAELSEDTKQTRKRTNPEESSSRQALKKKTSDPCQFEVGACPRRCIQTCLAVKVKIQPCLESDRIFLDAW